MKVFILFGMLFMGKSSSYKEDLLLILNLEYKSTNSLEKVNFIISEILSNLRLTQEQDTRLNKTRQIECDSEINFLDRPIEVMYSEITRSQQILSEKKPVFEKIRTKITEKNYSIGKISDFLAKIEESYLSESNFLQNEYFRTKEALKAVSKSLELLKSSEFSLKIFQVSDISQSTEIIPLSFLQYDQDSYSRLVDIFSDIEQDLKNNLLENNKRKIQIDEDYSRIKLGLEKVKIGEEEIKKILDRESLDLDEDIQEATRMIREASEECGSMVRARDDKIKECEAWSQQFEYETQKTSKQLQTIIEINAIINKDLTWLY